MSTKTNSDPTEPRAKSVRKTRKTPATRGAARSHTASESDDARSVTPETTLDRPSFDGDVSESVPASAETPKKRRAPRRTTQTTPAKAVDDSTESKESADAVSASKASTSRKRRKASEASSSDESETTTTAAATPPTRRGRPAKTPAKTKAVSEKPLSEATEAVAEDETRATSARKTRKKAESKKTSASKAASQTKKSEVTPPLPVSHPISQENTEEESASKADETQNAPEDLFIRPPRPKFALRKKIQTPEKARPHVSTEAKAVSAKSTSTPSKATLSETDSHRSIGPVSIASASESSTKPAVHSVSAASAAPETPPKPFSALGLSTPLLRAVSEMGYETPTPIQEQAIPEVLNGRDVLGVAQTGTGKTASFTLPLLEKLAHSRARARMPRALILEPTRELALQVAENFEKYGKHLPLSHALLIGGSSMNEQRELLNRGVDVLIATPGRLLDMFERGGLLLMQTDTLVIDEADRMLDMGFIPDIEKIVRLLPPRHQTLFFSATMAPEIRKLADAFLKTPKEITVSRQSSVATTITERAYRVQRSDKPRALRALLDRPDLQNAIVFCNRKRDVDTLYADLSRKGLSVGHLHGDLTQTLRFATLEKFRNDELKILVCSDVAARGIDIGGLSHVINYDLPFNAEDYVHRIGRTGRAGNEGHAFSLVTPAEKPLLEAVEALTGKTIEQATIPGVPQAPWEDESQDEPAIISAAGQPIASEDPDREEGKHRRKTRRRNEEKHQTPPEAPRVTAEAPPESTSPRREASSAQVARKTHEVIEEAPRRPHEAAAPRSAKSLPTKSLPTKDERGQRIWHEAPAENTLPLLKNGFLPPVPEKDADLPGFGLEEPDFMRIVYLPATHSFIEE